MSSETDKEVDIAIIGGGVAGCVAAIALANSFKIVVIDKLNDPVERIGECLAPAARRVLKQLDLLEGMERIVPSTGQSQHLKNIGTKSYWGSEQLHIIDHLRNPDGFGWHLDRKGFEGFLRETTLQRGVECLWSAKLHHARYEHSRWHLTTASTGEAASSEPQKIIARLVIDASGRQSHFARKQGVQRQHFDKLIASWATMSNFELDKMSTISASELGWWYSAPLPNDKRVIALQTDADLVEQKGIKDQYQFIELAQTNPEMKKILERNQGEIKYHKTVSANSSRLTEVAGQQWVALGDAAMSFDPLSSQGMFSAMAGSMELTEMIQNSGFMVDLDPAKMKQFQAVYTNRMDQIWAYYLKEKKLFYRQEMRWKESAFWKRRHF